MSAINNKMTIESLDSYINQGNEVILERILKEKIIKTLKQWYQNKVDMRDLSPLCGVFDVHNENLMGLKYCPKPSSCEEIYEKLKQMIQNSHISISHFLQMKINWATGNNSCALPIILKTNELAKETIKEPSLVPTGILLQHNIVPLCGELDYGISECGVNQSALSGCLLSWIDDKNVERNIDDSIGSLMDYAHTKPKSIEKIIEESMKEIKEFTWEKKLKFFSRLKILVLRVLVLTNSNEIKSSVETILNKLLVGIPEDLHVKVQQLIDQCNVIQPFHFSNLEKECIENPFPLIWATCTLNQEELFSVRSSISHEFCISKPVILGKDIQYVFTNNENVEKLRSIFKMKQIDISIFPFAVLRLRSLIKHVFENFRYDIIFNRIQEHEFSCQKIS